MRLAEQVCGYGYICVYTGVSKSQNYTEQNLSLVGEKDGEKMVVAQNKLGASAGLVVICCAPHNVCKPKREAFFAAKLQNHFHRQKASIPVNYSSLSSREAREVKDAIRKHLHC